MRRHALRVVVAAILLIHRTRPHAHLLGAEFTTGQASDRRVPQEGVAAVAEAAEVTNVATRTRAGVVQSHPVEKGGLAQRCRL